MSASQGLERAAFAAIVLFTSACSRPSSNSTSTAASNEPVPAPPIETSCEVIKSGFGPEGTTRVQTEVVADGLVVPWAVAFLPGGDILLTEREGRVRLIRGGKLLPDPVANVSITQSGEGGLLGLALDPRFAENRRFYLYSTTKKGDATVNRITRWVLDDARAREEAVVLDDIPAYSRHNGGTLRFGPDGMLYAGTGDAAKPDRSQDPATPAGKLLRIGTNGKPPADNPQPESPVYVRGLRNLQAFDWLDDGSIVLADHGPSGDLGRSGHDEIDVARAGQDLGWPITWSCERKSGTVTPLLVFAEAMPPGGGTYYRGDAIPAWKNSFLVGTLGSKHLHRFVLDSDHRRVTQHEVYLRGDPPSGFGRLRAVVTGPDGAVYVTTSNCDGRGECQARKDVLLRITAAR